MWGLSTLIGVSFESLSVKDSTHLNQKPIEFTIVISEEILLEDGSKGTRPSNSISSSIEVGERKQTANKSLTKVLDKRRAYAFSLIHTILRK